MQQNCTMLRMHLVSSGYSPGVSCSKSNRGARSQSSVGLGTSTVHDSRVWIGRCSSRGGGRGGGSVGVVGCQARRRGDNSWLQQQQRREEQLQARARQSLRLRQSRDSTDRSCFVGTMSKMNQSLPISMPPTSAALKEEQGRKTQRMTRRGALVALSYMGCAVMLVMFNKAALSTYRFPCANVITVLQMICSTALLYVLKSLDIISFAGEGNGAVELAADGFVPLRTLKRTSPLSIAYLFYMVVGMASIRGVNVPMYTTLRRTTVLFTMVMEFFLAGQKHSSPIVSSVGLIVLGAFIAGARDLSFDTQGYLIVLLSNLTTAIYLSTISRLGKTTGLNSFGLMWCNGVICGPILFLWILVSGELGRALQFPAVFFPGFQLVIVLSCMMAFCLNYTIFLNTSLNSPLTQTMCGNLKDLGTVLIGWLWFGGLPFDWLNVIGQFLGFVGSGVYAYCKLKGK
ncbi:solute carrier family 35, member D1/2/3 [Marchantia polymorpha subsp. ruderalis]|uniref:Sugar phosphate transporter domain-containing protein n=2 Tax=Marchantia polymorpha TaxID=3197 RepID=A0AAF6BTP8_MARPO|nr:hypothetical protein MARPO_0045s0147 [Marchantia polymorpha]BBN15382.1 hypothetical protein Mp_6g19160 [Marchantia polymorpha subsp. ruderalis]|eukprot:PTQ39506.1 hypothetical protein MARPO_0045s0147 [Marchantia polymorpha]